MKKSSACPNSRIIRDDGLTDHDPILKNMTVLPMLAQTFTGDGRRIEWPALAQPKIDGIRCTAAASEDDGVVVLRTRTGRVMTSPHLDPIRSQLGEILRAGIILDGELSSPDAPFEILSGVCRSSSSTEHTITIVLNVFDMIVEGVGFEERYRRVLSVVGEGGGHVRVVRTEVVGDAGDVRRQHDVFVGEGHEGVMIRNRHGVYRMGRRSWDLQKYKEFMEDEFTITGFSEGVGSDAGTVVWECATPGGARFHARPTGTRESRTRLLASAPGLIGSSLTVVYQGLTRHGIPRFPIGKCVRHDNK